MVVAQTTVKDKKSPDIGKCDRVSEVFLITGQR